jgi:hypothetical protein
MLEFVQSFLDISRHGEDDLAFDIILIEGNTTVNFATPIYGDGVRTGEGVD